MTVEMDIENYGLAFSDDDPVGDDPRYLDEFDVAHSEIAKIAGNDFSLIEQQCRYILLEKSKDLRIAGYLLLALTYLHGVNGLIEGLGIYNELLASFGAALHPGRPAARASAIKWLNHAKLESFIKKDAINDAIVFNTVKHQITRLNELLELNFPEIQSHFFILNTWLANQNIEPAKAPSMTAALIGKLIPLKPPAEDVSLKIENEQDYAKRCRDVFNYCKISGMRAQAISLSRSVHWPIHFSLPKHNYNKTLVMNIRKEGLDEINRLRELSDPTLLFNCCESALWDIGGPYLLDLNYYSYCALEQLGDTPAIEQLTFHMRQLIKRLPELPYLIFKDDSPFASIDTQQWINQLIAPVPTTSHATVQTANNEKNHQYFIEHAKKQATTNETSAYLQALKQLPTLSAREGIEKTFAIAKLLSATNNDLAMHHYQALLQKIEEQHIDKWLPELAINILSAYQTLLKTTNSNTKERSRITYWLCQLDPCVCL